MKKSRAPVFNYSTEARYADYPRRYSNEYHMAVGQVRGKPDAKGACATLHSARRQAAMAVDQGFCKVARIFDRRTGQYVYTYKNGVAGIIRHEGYVK